MSHIPDGVEALFLQKGHLVFRRASSVPSFMCFSRSLYHCEREIVENYKYIPYSSISCSDTIFRS